MTPLIEETANAAAKAAPGSARLSVLIPFYRDNPAPLLSTLGEHAPDGVEFILFDDGTPDPVLNAKVREALTGTRAPARLLSAKTNLGRAAARNRLARRARGAWLLFLDADMEAEADFLERWLALTGETSAQGLFGGYAPVAPATRALRLHAALAHASDVKPAAARAKDGAFAVCSSNLAVSAAAFAHAPFDEGYSGWGWEDVDWALGFSQRFSIAHVDNPARHGGLEPPRALLDKFSRSGPNFARLLARHPQYAARKGARLALRLKQTGLTGPARGLGWIAARAPLPVTIRVLGVKLFRAAVCAKALP